MPDTTFGHFDDEAREYVVTEPRTPWPWINYLGSQDFFSLISNTGGGYSFYRDAKFRRLTRYRYNNVPMDDGGRYFYIREGDSEPQATYRSRLGKSSEASDTRGIADNAVERSRLPPQAGAGKRDSLIWSPGWKPCRTELDHYECRHGMGYTRICGEKNGLRADVLYFVPPDDAVEVQCLRLENRSNERRTFKLFSLLEWCLWNAEDDMTNFQRNFSTGEVEVEGSVICHKTEFRERRNHYAFYGVNREIVGFDTDRETFLGPYRGLDRPAAVERGELKNSIARGWAPVASHCLEISLDAGESDEIIFLLGYVELPEEDKWEAPGIVNKAPIRELMARYGSPEKAGEALRDLKARWEGLLSRFRLQSGDTRLDRMVNTWNPYQNMVTFNLSRSASFFEAGIGRGMGFRDSNQDLLGSIYLEPERARERILDIAATQFEDGSVYHQYQPLTKRGNADIGGNFNDDPLWLILSTTAYIKETGDFGILDERVPFGNDEKRTGSLADHLRASFDHVVENRGPHGLPLIGRADWNDCLNLNSFSANPDESFQTTENREGKVAESVLIAAMFVLYGGEYARLCRRSGRTGESARAEQEVEAMRAAIDGHGWDGEWFLRAYDAAGRKLGSRENEEGRIFIEPQGFAVMAGIGLDDGRARSALDAVESRLACEYGIVLNHPAYSRYYPEYGEISTYPPGYKENGGIFCHNNPWVMIAETRLGRGDRAFDYYRRIAPAWQDHVALRKTEPYVYAQMVAGKEAARPGEAKNSWLTGTAAWNWHAVTEHMLGIKPDYDGLRIDPCIPADWPGYRVTRVFRGATYHIRVDNPDGVSRGVRSVTLDGRPMAGPLITASEAGAEYRIEVVMGPGE